MLGGVFQQQILESLRLRFYLTVWKPFFYILSNKSEQDLPAFSGNIGYGRDCKDHGSTQVSKTAYRKGGGWRGCA